MKEPIKKTINTVSALPAVISRVFKAVLISKAALVLLLIIFVVPLAAFEAHVVNVTAVIERRPTSCDALSIGYWRNHEGCDQGNGYSDWTTEVTVLSAGEFSGVFGTYSGQQICENLWIPNCPSGSGVDSKLCKSKALTLADELNVVSGRLDLDALIAGADDGDQSFDDLGLGYGSSVRTALQVIEMILANSSSSVSDLTSAGYVAERIYAFYEDENPLAPACVYNVGGVGEPTLNNGVSVSIETPEVSLATDGNAVLNEILHDPVGLDDGNGLKGEWVEVYNNEDFPIDLDGWYVELYSAPGNRQTISFTNTDDGSTIIGARGSGDEWMVVFMDGGVLNNFGERVSFYNASGVLKDEYTIKAIKENGDAEESDTLGDEGAVQEEQEELLSLGRGPDGGGLWTKMVPTPGDLNVYDTREGEKKLTEIVEEELPPENIEIEPEGDGDIEVGDVVAGVIDAFQGMVGGADEKEAEEDAQDTRVGHERDIDEESSQASEEESLGEGESLNQVVSEEETDGVSDGGIINGGIGR